MTRAYTYGLLPPTWGRSLVLEQMRRAHDYRNKLVEIELTRRAGVREILSRGDDPQLQARADELTRQRDEARAQILRTRSAARRAADSPDQRARARALGAEIAAVVAEIRARRRTPSESARVGLAWVEVVAAKAVKDARATCGVYWGTYLLHERAMRASASTAASPELIPWRGEGRVSVQTQGGIAVDELASDTQIQILPGRPIGTHGEGGQGHPVLRAAVTHVRDVVSTRADPRSGMPLHGNGYRVGGGARRGRVLRLRVGSEGPGNRTPIWAEWPMQMHRPLPDGCRVKMATVSLRRRGTRWDWSVQIVVDDDACARPSAPESGVVALNLGYALRDDGRIRVGYVVGSDGHRSEILLPRSVPSSLDKADAIRSQRDHDLDAARAQLAAWVNLRDPASIPAWFRERTTSLASWRSPGRLAALVHEWQRGWWDGGAEGYDLVERWRIRDLHLERYETGLRSSALRRRRDAYRVLARELAGQYRTLVVDDTDLRDLQRLPIPESEEDPAWPAARRQRTVAAPHELRGALLDAFGPERTRRDSAVDVTVVHATCGHRNERSVESREVTCAGCGMVYDQDENACQNLLLRERQDANSRRETARESKPAKKRTYRIRKHTKAPQE